MASDSEIRDIATRLLPAPPPVPERAALQPDWTQDVVTDVPPVPAAVLIALVRRAGRYRVLYTERSVGLRNHSGQVAFPGGRIDADDRDPAFAALREANEEVALHPEDADVLGYMPHYYTGTNYLITPVVALVEPRGPFVANPHEVNAVFEVPLETVADEGSYGIFRGFHRGRERQSWQIEHAGHRIWGITANLTRRFRDTVLIGEADDEAR